MDNIESWSTNEVTINWNSPFAWVTSYMDDNGCANKANVVQGAVNNDGEVDILDYISLQKSIAVGESISSETADLNGDGKVNAADLLALRKNIKLIKVFYGKYLNYMLSLV